MSSNLTNDERPSDRRQAPASADGEPAQPSETDVADTQLRPRLLLLALRDMLLLAACLVLPFAAARWGGSIEKTVWARVVRQDENSNGAHVDYCWEGRHYEKRIHDRRTFRQGDVVRLRFVGSPASADLYNQVSNPPHIRATVLRTFACFFAAGGLMMVLWGLAWGWESLKRRPLREGERLGIAPAASELLDVVLTRLRIDHKYRVPIIVASVLATVVCYAGVQEWSRPDRTPERLAENYLAAVRARDFNRACYLVGTDHRYAFLSWAPSWHLMSYEILSVSDSAIRFRHTSQVHGQTVAGETTVSLRGHLAGPGIPPDVLRAMPDGTGREDRK